MLLASWDSCLDCMAKWWIAQERPRGPPEVITSDVSTLACTARSCTQPHISANLHLVGVGGRFSCLLNLCVR
jgi:hypothetical protein